MFTAEKSPLTPFTDAQDDIFNPANWGNSTVGPQFDAARHFGAIGMTGLMDTFRNQLGQVGAGAANQAFARGGLNALMTPQGREQQVKQVGRANDRAAYATGKKLRNLIMQSSGRDIGEAGTLAALNQSADSTNDYRAMMESPQGQMQIFQAIQQANDPMQILSVIGPMMGLNEQDYPRFIAWVQQSAAEKAAGGLGGMLGGIGQIAGLLSGGGGAGAALGALGALGGSDASSGGIGQTQVTRR